MPFRPPVHKPPGWKPAVKRADPLHDFYGTAEWKRIRERVKKRDGYRCTDPNCQTPGRGLGDRVIVDHIVERRHGGSDHDTNLRTLCPACDNRRHGHRQRNLIVR